MKTGKNTIFRYFGIIVVSFLVGLLAGKLAIPVSQTNALSDLVVNENSSENSAIIENKQALSEATFDAISTQNSSTTVNYANTSLSTATAPSNGLYIAKTGLSTSVTGIDISYDKVPDYNVGQDGSLLVGHNPGIFSSLFNVTNGDIITLNGKNYRVSLVATFDLISKTKLKNSSLGLTYTAGQLRSLSSNKIVLMTCTGTYSQEYGTYSSRLLVFADLA